MTRKDPGVIARALTIAGSDCSGGAGLQADLKTFTVFRVYGMSVVTALTAQNTTGVSGVFAVSPEFVRQQIDAVVTDVGVDAAKTGMLASRAIIRAVSGAVRDYGITSLVVDPVMVAQSGASLLETDAVDALRDELLPLAAIATPNVPEASVLLGMDIASVDDMRRAAERFVAGGVRAVLLKGGHLAGAEAVDVFHDGREMVELRASRTPTRHTHGTGCMTAAAITAGLARGLDLTAAVSQAKRFIGIAIAAGLPIGHGCGPANPLAWLERHDEPAASGESSGWIREGA